MEDWLGRSLIYGNEGTVSMTLKNAKFGDH